MIQSKALLLASMLAMGIMLGNILYPTYIFADESSNNPQTRSPPTPPWVSNLTDVQKEEIQQLVQSMKDAGASQEDIMSAVNAKLAEWGIEVPEHQGPRNPPWMQNLTDDQKEQIQQLIDEMRENGANREEIREAIVQQLEEWGIEIPECPRL